MYIHKDIRTHIHTYIMLYTVPSYVRMWGTCIFTFIKYFHYTWSCFGYASELVDVQKLIFMALEPFVSVKVRQCMRGKAIFHYRM